MKAVTLLYHDAIRNGDYDESGFIGSAPARYKIETKEMEKHFAAVANARDQKPMRVTDFINVLAAQDDRGFFLTFDDGGVSAITQIAPLLESFGWIGHFFVTAGMIGQPSFLSSEQIRELAEGGHLIGSLSWSHPARMSKCTMAELQTEWGKSIGLLSEILGETVRIASVPGGYFSTNVARVAAECGISALFTSEPTKKAFDVGGCMVLGRYTLLNGMSPTVSGSLASEKLSAQQIHQSGMWETKKIVKKLTGEKYLSIRRALLRKLTSR